MLRVVLAALVVAAVQAPQPSVKEMFYDPVAGKPVGDQLLPPAPMLKAVRLPERGIGPQFVGIHYWFQDRRGRYLSEAGAAAEKGPLTLHIRSNWGGALSVWLIDRPSAVLLTPMSGGYPGCSLIADTLYNVPLEFEFVPSGSKRLVLLFSRSQTEQAHYPTEIPERIRFSETNTGRDGKILFRDADDSTPGQIGNYLVSRIGILVATEIKLQSR